MENFKHYIITRFNLGLYNDKARIKIDPDQWMQHRIDHFAVFTLPSVMGQTCQNFTWLILLDKKTPQKYKNMLESIEYQNLKIIYTDTSQEEMPLSHEFFCRAVLNNVAPGDYDLITTRIDNDDIFHKDAVSAIQQWYAPRPVAWKLVFDFGYLLDADTGEMYLMEYIVNNFVSMIEKSTEAKTVFRTGHTTLSADDILVIREKAYWAMIVHSQNIANTMTDGGCREIYRHEKIPLSALADFTIDVNTIKQIGVCS